MLPFNWRFILRPKPFANGGCAMTKLRDPMTPQSALLQIVALLGWDGAADAINREESAIRKYSDNDTARHLSFQDAIRLDIAFQKAGGAGWPLMAVYSARLKNNAPELIQGAPSFQQFVSQLAKESGEAMAAAIIAQGTPKARKVAIKEVDELMTCLANFKLILERGE